MKSVSDMDKSITIRPITSADVDQVIQLARTVQRDMAVDIIRDQLAFLARHPWPYAIAAIFVIICRLVSEWGLLQSLLLGLAIAAVEEGLRFAFFVSRWLDIFYLGDDVKDVVKVFSERGRQFLVAECGGRVVGTVAISEQEGGRPRVGHITRLFVLSSFRGRGLGRRLMEAITASLGRMGYTSAELLTHHTNTRALNFYKKQGYKVFNIIHYASVYPYAYDQHELVRVLD